MHQKTWSTRESHSYHGIGGKTIITILISLFQVLVIYEKDIKLKGEI